MGKHSAKPAPSADRPGAAPAGYRLLAGVGGIGTGLFFRLQGDHTLGRNESRPGRQLDVRDYCKLHIIAHYVAVLTRAAPGGSPFHVLPIGKVGDDAIGRRLMTEMKQAGMDVRFVQPLPGRPTQLSVCFQYPDGSGGNITAVESAASDLTTADVDAVEPLLAAAGRQGMVLAAPEVSLETRHHLLQLAGRRGALRAASITSAEVAEVRDRDMFAAMDLLAINEDEAAAVAGVPFDPGHVDRLLDACARTLRDVQPDMAIVVTAGKHGAYAFSGGRWDHRPALEVPVASTAGAGDALLGAVLAGLASGLPLTYPEPGRAGAGRPFASALDLGVLLAAFTVTSPHTIHPEANGPALLEFAARQGLSLSPALRDLLAAHSA